MLSPLRMGITAVSLFAACSTTSPVPPSDGGCATGCQAGLVCANDSCVPERCGADGGCPSPLQCIAGFCASVGCDPPCPLQQSCLGGVCIPKQPQTCTTDAQCTPPATCVGDFCVDTDCAPACDPSQVCASQICIPTSGTSSCAPPYSSCLTAGSTYCANLANDSHNCGACGTSCPSGQICNGQGSCATSCLSTELLCGSGESALCIDPQSDDLNCGACGNACPAGQACSMGSCSQSCGAASRCGVSPGLYCANLESDPFNCGSCGYDCGEGQLCAAGACIPIATTSATAAGGTGSTASGTGSGGSAVGSTSGAATGTTGGSTGGLPPFDAGASCTIDGTSYSANAFSPTSLCLQCLPFVSTSSWTEIGHNCGVDAGGCTIDGVAVQAYAGGNTFSGAYGATMENPLDGCEVCLPDAGTAAWSTLPNGAFCLYGTCQAGVCQCAAGSCLSNNYCDNPSDDQNCGGCNSPCPAGLLCAQGSCVHPATLNTARSDFAVGDFCSGDVLIAIGGRNDGGPLNAVENLVPANNAWTAQSSLPLARYGLAAVKDPAGDILAAGGTVVLSDGGQAPAAEVDALLNGSGCSPGSWIPYPQALPLAVGSVAGIDQQLGAPPLLFGGLTASGAPTAEVQTTGDGGPSYALWLSSALSLPAPLSGLIAVVTQLELEDGPLEVVILGGLDDAGQPSAGMWKLANGAWSVLDAGWPNPRPGAAGAIDHHGFIYVAGGTLPDGGFSDEFDIYNPFSNQWAAGPPLPTARTGLSCVQAPVVNRINCIGGFNGQFLTTVEAYLLETGTWAH